MKIGEFLIRKRVPVDIESDKTYKLVTIRLKHKGVVLREEKKGSDIGSKVMYKVSEGDFILSGIDARNGAFGIVPKELDGAVVTNDFWYFDVDKNKVDKEFFLFLTSTSLFDEICRKGSDGTTNRVRLQADKFFNQWLNLPDANEQILVLSKLKKTKYWNNELICEADKQEKLIVSFQQSILQDAIQGKLVSQDQNDEPASELLKKIKAEREKLIKEGKLKKEKLLPPIKTEEIPFELPKGWIWCRLQDICFDITDGTHHTPRYVGEGVPFLSVKDISKGTIDFNNCKYITEEEHLSLIKRCKPEFNNVLLTKVGTTGIAKVIDTKQEFSIFVSLALLKSHYLINSYYLENCINSPFVKQQSSDGTWGVGNKNLVLKTIKTFLIPIPPLKEQERIVTKLEEVKLKLSILRDEVKSKMQKAELLMQAVLQEAFN